MGVLNEKKCKTPIIETKNKKKCKINIDFTFLYFFSVKVGVLNVQRCKNKLIILDNASSHRNPKVKEVINKENHLLYAVPYQHFTNSIENYFSMLKSHLQKLDGLTHGELKNNIKKKIRTIPKEKYRNIIKGAYERPEKYVSNKNNTRKIKKNYL
jgi:hypothetical protein